MEQVEGAGLAESFGTFFIILLLLVFWIYYQNPYRIPSLILSSLVWGLTVMASPASAYLSVFIFFTLVFMLIRREKDNIYKIILYILVMGLLAVLLSSLYWGTVIKNHGLDLLVNSFVSQHEGSSFILSFFVRLAKMDLIINEPLLSILYIAALFVLLYKKKYELLFLSVFSVLIPRENWIMGIIGILIIGFAADLILKNLRDNFLKKVLGLDAVAFTYDWGVASDVAQRNQLRMCNKLGVEQILIKANLDRKRKNIKANLLAWLKKPDLGTIPVLTSVGQQFFYHANQVGKKLGRDLIVLCATPLEHTYFKAGFSGIKPSFAQSNNHASDKVKLALNYFKKYIH